MKETKKSIIAWAKYLALVIYAILTIATCAGVWNHCPEPFVKWCAGFIFAANGFATYVAAKKIYESRE